MMNDLRSVRQLAPFALLALNKDNLNFIPCGTFCITQASKPHCGPFRQTRAVYKGQGGPNFVETELGKLEMLF